MFKWQKVSLFRSKWKDVRICLYLFKIPHFLNFKDGKKVTKSLLGKAKIYQKIFKLSILTKNSLQIKFLKFVICREQLQRGKQ